MHIARFHTDVVDRYLADLDDAVERVRSGRLTRGGSAAAYTDREWGARHGGSPPERRHRPGPTARVFQSMKRAAGFQCPIRRDLALG